MSNVIPLGARIDDALPIPLQQSYKDHMYQIMMLVGTDIKDIESISAQRWLSLKSYLKHLKQQDNLNPLWEALGTKPDEDPYPALLQFALFMRFRHLNGELYETPAFIESYLATIHLDDVSMGQMALVTGKPVYIHLKDVQPTLFLNNNPKHLVTGAYLQYEQNENGQRLYYLIHAKTNGRPTLSGHISLNSPQQTLKQVSTSMWVNQEVKHSNQVAFEAIMSIWWLWSTKQFSETRYKEYDMIAALNHGHAKQRRLKGAYNRTQFKLKGHHA